MVHRLDTMDAYNQHLVKKIAVGGITLAGSTVTDSWIDRYKNKAPTARLGFDEAYLNYLDKISAHETRQGYFSIDKKKGKQARFVESKVVYRRRLLCEHYRFTVIT